MPTFLVWGQLDGVTVYSGPWGKVYFKCNCYWVEGDMYRKEREPPQERVKLNPSGPGEVAGRHSTKKLRVD